MTDATKSVSTVLVLTGRIVLPMKDISQSFFDFMDENSKRDNYYYQKLKSNLLFLNNILENVVLEDIPAEDAKSSLGLYNTCNLMLTEFLRLMKKDARIGKGTKNELLLFFYRCLSYFSDLIEALELYADNDLTEQEQMKVQLNRSVQE